MKTILLTGANGQVGWELRRTLAPLGKVVAPSSAELDLADADAIRRLVREIRPHLIVNPAAYTAVDKAESEPELAMAVNGIAPGILAEEARRIDARLVHYSTDYVFDGTKPGPYCENDPTGPVSSYGRSKLAGEEAIRAVGLPHLIFRTAWVYGARGKNFMLTMLRMAKERDALRVVADQFGTPTWSRMIAEATALAIVHWQSETDLSGVFHLTNSGQTSWHGFAQAILREYQARQAERSWPALKVSPQAIAAITAEQYPTPAQRPANSVLDNTKLREVFGLELPDWQDALALVMEDAATLAI